MKVLNPFVLFDVFLYQEYFVWLLMRRCCTKPETKRYMCVGGYTSVMYEPSPHVNLIES